MEDKPLQIVENNEFVIVSKEYCKNVIQKLCVISFSSSLIIKAYNSEDDNYKFSKKNLGDILSGLDFKFNSFSSERASFEKIRKKIVEQYSFMLPFYYKRNNIKEKCLKLAETFNNIFTFSDYLFSDEKIMMRELELLCSFIQVDYDFYYLVDLIAAKDDMVENLKYIYDFERVVVFEEQYNLAIENLDASALKNLLESTQNLILKHWEEYLTDIDSFKPGKPFRFLCHSMDELFEGKFHSNIVSMSLLTEQLHDVFNDEYGFIFDASNIIAADSSDMFINNYAESDDNILYYSTIKRILAPEKIERDCLRQKNENQENLTGKKIYSEVAKRGFNPIGIFCLTEGGLRFNSSYEKVLDLKDLFPNLKIIEIDKTLYNLSENELKEIMVSLIYELKCHIYGEYSVNYSQIESLVKIGAYDEFWQEFMTLKKKEYYNENDILTLFKKYELMINGKKDIANLFDSYSKKEITYFLKYNPIYGASAILFGRRPYYFANIPINFELCELGKVYDNLKPLAGDKRLDDFIPGLSTFLQLYGFVLRKEFCDNAKLRVRACNNFVDINLIFMSYLRKEDLEQLIPVGDVEFLNQSSYVENLNDYIPEILRIEDEINSCVNIIMEFLNSQLFLKNNEDAYSACMYVKGIINELKDCDLELKAIEKAKEHIIENNKLIDEEVKKLMRDQKSHFRQIKELLKERLANIAMYNSYVRKESEVKKNRIGIEQRICKAKIDFRDEVDIDYDDFVEMYQHAKDIEEISCFYGINVSGDCRIFNEKVELDRELDNILSKINMTIGQVHDYIDNYYNKDVSGLKM